MQEFVIELDENYLIAEGVRGLCAREWEQVFDMLAAVIENGKQRGVQGEGKAREAAEMTARMEAELAALRAGLDTQRFEIAVEERARAGEELKRLERGFSEKLQELEAAGFSKARDQAEELVNKTREIDELKAALSTREFKILSEERARTAELIGKLERDFSEKVQEIKASAEAAAEARFTKISAADRGQFFEALERLAAQKIAENPQVSTTAAKLDTIMETLKPITRHYTGSNSEKGISGEFSVLNILNAEKQFADAKIEDVSGTAASGDILFTRKKVKCMIEIKNKQKVTQSDLVKFERDVTKMAEDNRINCAMFVSLDDDRLPGKTLETIQIEFIGKTPVVFLYSPPPSNEVCVVLKMLDRLVEIDSLDAQNEMARYIIDCYQMTINLKQYFEQAINKTQKELKVLQKQFDSVDDMCKKLIPLQPKQPQEEKLHSTHIEIAAKAYLDMANEGITITTENMGSFLGIPVSDGELENIAKEAITQYVNSNLPDDQAVKLVEFNSKNNRWPTRKECKAEDIVSEYFIRKFAKISKGYKFETVIGLAFE